MMNGFSGSLVNDIRRSRTIEKNKRKVDGFLSFKRQNYMAHESCAPCESEESEDGKSQYSLKISIDDELPELVVFLHETNYEFVKDICIDKVVTSHGNYYEENCGIKNGFAPGFPECNIVDNESESTEESEELESSISSVESAEVLENDINKATEQQKFCYDAADELPYDIPKKKGVPKIPLFDGEAAGRRTASASLSIAMSLRKVLDEKNRVSKVERGRLFYNSKLSVSSIGSCSNKRADCQCCHECEKQTGEYGCHGFDYQHNQREISSVALDPVSSSAAKSSVSSYSGSPSLRSNSSTSSSHSFAFPILQREWNGSPERMLNADRMQPRRHELWRLFFPCCKF